MNKELIISLSKRRALLYAATAGACRYSSLVVNELAASQSGLGLFPKDFSISIMLIY